MDGSFPGREIDGSYVIGTDHHQGADESIHGIMETVIHPLGVEEGRMKSWAIHS